MNVTEEELAEVSELFKEINKLFFNRINNNTKNYSEICFYKENEFRYFKFLHRGIEFEIYFINNQFKYNILTRENCEKEILQLIMYIKNNFMLLFNKITEAGKFLSYTFESGDIEEIMLARCRKRNNMI